MDEQNNQMMPNQDQQNVTVNLVLGIVSIVAGLLGLAWGLVPAIAGLICAIVAKVDGLPHSNLTRLLSKIGLIVSIVVLVILIGLMIYTIIIANQIMNQPAPSVQW